MRFLVLAMAIAGPAVSAAQTPSPTPEASPTATPSEAEAALLESLEKDLGSAPPAAAPSPARSSALSVSNAFNPAMSVNGLFLGTYTSAEPPDPAAPEADEATKTGMAIQEIEVQFLSNVDPYFRANLIAAMEGGEGFAIEEGYLEPFWQPWGFSFRVGKLKGAFGRENWVHAHGLPFVDRSLVGPAVFGAEGLGEFGAEASWLSPLPWYLLLTAQFLDGENELFASERGDDFLYLGSGKTLVELGDDATLEVGGFGAGGNDANGTLATAAGAHLFVKWRPARHATTRGVTLVGEWIYSNRKNPDPDPLQRSLNTGGGYGFLQARLSRRFYIAGRYDYVGEPLEEGGITRRSSAILVFAPTEFSSIRVQGSEVRPPFGEDPVQEAFLQLNFTLGAHPAHAY